ncbi:MAG: hypothetical protein HC927_07705 [Deltaproteobacteria bacterium]|nr:hypothetical protein [Deltaproteobacteria bacterium]
MQEEEPEEPAASTPEKQQKAKLVNVELVANDYYYVEAKIGGRIFKLSPIAKTKLPAGTHSLYLRPSDKQPWKRAGRITLSPDGSSRVEMLDPPGAKVSSI